MRTLLLHFPLLLLACGSKAPQGHDPEDGTGGADSAGDECSRVVDAFMIEAEVDILFAVERSGSMEDDRESIAENMSFFLDVLDLGGYRYQISIPGQSNGCSSTDLPWVNEGMARSDQEEALLGMLVSGDVTCNGTCFSIVDLALLELGPGGCNEGLVRDGRLLVIGVNDFRDSLPDAGSDEVTHLQRLLTDPEDLVISAIGPDSADTGCHADPMQSWEEAAALTGGTYQSICTHDMGLTLETIGLNAAAYPGRSFPLSEIPIEDTILMTVDGVERNDWSWDSVRNEVSLPEGSEAGEGASVEIGYTPQSACPEDEGE